MERSDDDNKQLQLSSGWGSNTCETGPVQVGLSNIHTFLLRGYWCRLQDPLFLISSGLLFDHQAGLECSSIPRPPESLAGVVLSYFYYEADYTIKQLSSKPIRG